MQMPFPKCWPQIALLSLGLVFPSTIALAQAQIAQHDGTPLSLPPASPLSEMADIHLSMDAHAPLPEDARILLVLNRFTNGPRPGELEHLREIGLKEWFQQQLNPQRIDDRALEERLDAYPAMRMPLNRMLVEFPANEDIRQSLNNKNFSIDSGDADGRAVFLMRRAALEQKINAKNGEDSNKPDQVVTLPKSLAEIEAMPPEDRYHFLCRLSWPKYQQLKRDSHMPQDRATLYDGLSARQLETLEAFDAPTEMIASEDVDTKLLEDLYSERQLEEVMVDFWLNHFNLYMRKNQRAPYYIARFEREAIRPFALGRFENLLLATAQSPAMLDYLDQTESVGPHSLFALRNDSGKKTNGLNENYAREVMELHTIGVNGGYTQKDVTELAKVLTGWTIERRDGFVRPIFDARKHEPGSKTVLGHKIHEGGVDEGLTVLRMLAASPQCARFISTKLAARFVSDTPPPALVERMTQAYLLYGGDIRQVLAAMINSPEFFTVATYRSKVKTPQDFVLSAVRATGAEVSDPGTLGKAIADLGQPLWGHQTPEGYSMASDAWNSTTSLVSRMNFSMALATNRVQGVDSETSVLFGAEQAQMPVAEKQEQIEARLLHVPLSQRTEALISAETNADPETQRKQLRQIGVLRGQVQFGRNGARDWRVMNMRPSLDGVDLQAALTVGLVLGSPEFQRR